MSETIPKSFVKIGDGPPQKCSVLPEYSLLGLRVIPNFYLYFTNLQRFPEFSGYKAQRFPGQPGPRSITLLPKGRFQDLESLAADIQKIKTRAPISIQIDVEPTEIPAGKIATKSPVKIKIQIDPPPEVDS